MFNFSLKECKELTFRQGLWVLALVYGVLVTLYLIQYQGIPYVFDNNESFSSIVHAKNLLQFDFFKTYGLTDESFGVLEAAHPYVYTHQGNFPRLYAALLYVLGLKSIQWQIIGHLVTINTLALYFAYSYFSKKISPLFALIYCLILLTDYVMNFQWQFNTWRVWHCFFMFSSLMLVEKYNDIDNKFYIPLLLLNFIALAYCEITYAIFIAILTSTLFIFKLRKFKIWFKPLSLIAIASAIGFGILIFQSILYFGGMSGFLSDLSFTFTARNKNHADSMEFTALVTQIWSFVEENHLVFWGNFATNAENLRSIISAIKLFLRYNLMIYSPFLVLILILLYSSFALNWLIKKIENGTIYKKELFLKNDSFNYKLPTTIILSAVFILIIFNSNIIFNLGIVDFYVTKYGIVLALILISFLIHWVLPKIQDAEEPRVFLHHFMVLMAFLCIFFLYAVGHMKIFFIKDDFTSFYADFWQDLVLFKFGGGIFSKLVFLSSLIFVTFVIIGDPLYQIPAKAKKALNLSNLIYSGLIGGLVCWLVLPGYIYSAYYVRYVPFFEYLTILFIVVPIYILTRMIISFFSKINRDNKSILILNVIQALPLLVIYSFILFTWIFLQFSYYSKFQTNNYELLRKLSTPQYQSASFVSNAYAAPFAVQANQWAYLDSDFSLGRVNRTIQGYSYGIDDKYLWVKDKNSNKNYKNPDYFVCFMNSNFDFVGGNDPRCDRDVPLISRILDRNSASDDNFSSIIKPTIVEMDTSGQSRWAIIKLDNDFPPYLIPFQNNRFININKSSNGLELDYRYTQQNSIPEVKSLIKIYKLNSCSNSERPILVSSLNNRQISSLTFLTGVFQVSVVPQSETKLGEEYWSEPFSYVNGVIKYCGQSKVIQAPQDLEVESKADGRKGLLKWQKQEGLRYFEIEQSANGANFVPLTTIDSEKADVYVGSALDARKRHFRVRACNDWACSPWAVKAPS